MPWHHCLAGNTWSYVELAALNVTKTQASRYASGMNQSTERELKFSGTKIHSELPWPFMSRVLKCHEIKWCLLSFWRWWCQHCRVFFPLKLLLFMWILFFFLPFPQYWYSPLLCLEFVLSVKFLKVLHLSFVVYCEWHLLIRIYCAIPLEAPWDTPHMALCSLSFLEVNVYFDVCVGVIVCG